MKRVKSSRRVLVLSFSNHIRGRETCFTPFQTGKSSSVWIIRKLMSTFYLWLDKITCVIDKWNQGSQICGVQCKSDYLNQACSAGGWNTECITLSQTNESQF